MVFPLPNKKPMAKPGLKDDPLDELMSGPHAEPDQDESFIDDAMNEQPDEGADLFGAEDPLESALTDAGFNASPDQLAQIKSILQPAGKPAAKKPMIGGAVPGGMTGSDLMK